MATAFPTSKRSACDRCRTQKLRCPPREPPTDACGRCIRLGAWCVTSYGRPSAVGSSVAASTSASSRVAKGVVVGPPAELRPRGSGTGSSSAGLGARTLAPTAPTAATAVPTTQGSGLSASVSVAEGSSSQTTDAISTAPDPLGFTVSGDHLDTFTRPPMGSTFFPGPIFPHGDEVGSGPLYHDLDSLSSLLTSPGLATGNSSGGTVDLLEATSQQPDDGLSFLNDTDNEKQQQRQPRSDVLRCDPRLSSLSLDLSRRLQQCLDLTTKATPLQTPPSADDGDLMPGRDGALGSQLFSDALGDLSEFLVILQSYCSSPAGTSGTTTAAARTRNRNHRPTASQTLQSRRRAGSRPGSRPIGIVVILNLLAAYLQMVAVYDKLFHSLARQLQSGGSVLEAGSARTIAGSSPPQQQNNRQSTLQTKIVIHAVLHQFETIERLLGLPAALRVTTTSHEEITDDSTDSAGGPSGSCRSSGSGAFGAGLFGDDELARELAEVVSREDGRRGHMMLTPDDEMDLDGLSHNWEDQDHPLLPALDHGSHSSCSRSSAPASLRGAIRRVQTVLDM